MTLPNYTIIFWLLAALFAGNAGFYLSEVLRYPTRMNNDPGNTFGMFLDFILAGILVVFGFIALVQHSRYARDNTPVGQEK